MTYSGVNDPETLVALAVREGLNLAHEVHLNAVRVACDCCNVIKALKEENLGKYCHILHEIKSGTMGFEETTSFVHEN
jgi:hypothetical protein